MADSIFTQMGVVLNTKLTTLQSTLQSNIDSASTDISGLTTDLSNEVTRATGAESTLTTNLNNEISRAQAAEASLQTDCDGKLSASGGDVSGNVTPATTSSHDLGVMAKAWRNMYLGTGVLSVNGHSALQDSSGTIQLSANDNNNVRVKAGGSGNIELNTSTGSVTVNGAAVMEGTKFVSTSAPGAGDGVNGDVWYQV